MHLPRHSLRLIALTGLLALPACSGTALVDALTPSTGYSVERGLAYGGDPRQRYDLYRPDLPDPALPVLVFLYGGGWDTGTRESYRFVGQAFAARGFTVAIPDYRLYPAVRWPAFLEDTAAAIAALHRTEGRKVALVGHSAGAYNAVSVTLDRRWLAAEGLDVCDAVVATVGLAGPYDFLPFSSDKLGRIFAPANPAADSQPISHARGDAPPLLLVTGGLDTTVLPRNTDRLAAAVTAAGGSASVLRHASLGHAALIGAVARPLRFLAPVLEETDAFLRARAAAPSPCPPPRPAPA